MEQLLLHLLGDYILQSDWMANGKTYRSLPCLIHATIYTLPFLLLRPSAAALLTIWITHFLIDRYRVAKYVCYFKNFLCPVHVWLFVDRDEEDGTTDWWPRDRYVWTNCNATGYPSDVPPFLAMWLMIITDNTMHLAINYLSLRYL